MTTKQQDLIKNGQRVWLLTGTKVESYWVGKFDKDVLMTTPEETPTTEYRLRGSSTLHPLKSQAIQAKIDVLVDEIAARQSELATARNTLLDAKAAEKTEAAPRKRSAQHEIEDGPGC